jgi:hypothetical protein
MAPMCIGGVSRLEHPSDIRFRARTLKKQPGVWQPWGEITHPDQVLIQAVDAEWAYQTIGELLDEIDRLRTPPEASFVDVNMPAGPGRSIAISQETWDQLLSVPRRVSRAG